MIPFITSAPGKVIIFGEHSAVYNEPAVAASVSSLRTFLLVEDGAHRDTVALNFPDIKFHHEWRHSEIHQVIKLAEADGLLTKARKDTNNLSQPLVTLLEEKLLGSLKESLHFHAAFCFIYLYVCLCPNVNHVKFSLKSTLPIGAGLGSSASISVALSLAMAKLGGHIKSTESLTSADKKYINSWSFIGEKCIHGTPSGIDNAVATYGNAVLFKKEDNGSTNFQFIDNFPKIPMILTYTRIPRSTKVLVSNVRELVEKYPSIFKPILQSMGHLANDGADILRNLNDKNYNDLLELVRVNHGLLVSLGVSHPGLEIIKSLSDTMDLGSTKLTGAGGGGCSLTILKKDVTQDQIKTFKSILKEKHNYGTYDTDLGGMGCSFVSLDSIPEKDAIVIKAILEARESPREQLTKFLFSDESVLTWKF
ncbi:hypothetical protein Kpol_1064p33 [Vanderwaltozyma polyspora DSM 70294]|uniref:Mevalonate kinase n=1 Tax=Vanderwaltozyma polyspora (strain ATCC 22028 / DSM 70294 / BCRC 21397 / CBS 2163 / NBRC 10782 / NRRL Y-8283 / UCD 57-17) TaxID=436907 RepID=A7TMF7_VANPO|nr:uncharacterized protein Kpol_1064p33 [Vanderwaltozyma polyspora DSM 70294]EDO16551.1 hypothetical protein Kpol_1064p33 [Vanderwaltozyma polyspora DSM 70294]